MRIQTARHALSGIDPVAEWREGNNDGQGYAPADHTSHPQTVLALTAAGWLLVEPAHCDTDVDVWLQPDGTITAIGDLHGPWAVDIGTVTELLRQQTAPSVVGGVR